MQFPLILPDTPISEKSDVGRIDESSCSSEWSRGPGSDRWDILLDEAERFRQKQSERTAELKENYGDYCDTEKCFPDDSP